MFGLIKHCLRYLKGNKSLGLSYPYSTDDREGNELEIKVLVDSDLAGAADKKSTTGYLVYINHRLVMYRTKKQSTVATSTCNAELNGISDGAKAAQWLRGLLFTDLGLLIQTPTQIYNDNQPAISLCENIVSHATTRHFALKQAALRELKKRNIISVHHMAGECQAADLLTKALDRVRFNKLLQLMLSPDAERENHDDKTTKAYSSNTMGDGPTGATPRMRCTPHNDPSPTVPLYASEKQKSPRSKYENSCTEPESKNKSGTCPSCHIEAIMLDASNGQTDSEAARVTEKENKTLLLHSASYKTKIGSDNKKRLVIHYIATDRFGLRSHDIHKLSMERIVTLLVGTIVRMMTTNTKQLLSQARQDRLRNTGGLQPPLFPRQHEYVQDLERDLSLSRSTSNDLSCHETQSCSSTSSWSTQEPPPLPTQRNASTEDQQDCVFGQPEIEVEMNNEANTGIPFEPMTPVPMADPVELMSPAPNMEDEDNVDIGDWSKQLDQLTTANQEALQDLQIEEQKK